MRQCVWEEKEKNGGAWKELKEAPSKQPSTPAYSAGLAACPATANHCLPTQAAGQETRGRGAARCWWRSSSSPRDSGGFGAQ